MSTWAKKAATRPILILLSAMECNVLLFPPLAIPQCGLQGALCSHRILHCIFEQLLRDLTRATRSLLRCFTALRPSVTWHSCSWGTPMEESRSYPWCLARVRVCRNMAHCEDPAMGYIGWRVILSREAVASLAPLGRYTPRDCHGYRYHHK
jgi:hypothetical protein